MKNLYPVLKIGTRASKLAINQTEIAIKNIRNYFPELKFTVVPFSSPGDRDRKIDLRKASPDFFTCDLDKSLLQGTIDCAIHSAKDVPLPTHEGIDWFWLPWQEDNRDVIVLSPGKRLSKLLKETSGKIRIGISSERREKFCCNKFPRAELFPIRGNVENRIAQLDKGNYDMLILAAAGLLRMGLQKRISEYIDCSELSPPEGQGVLAMTFARGNSFFTALRNFFIKQVVVAGAGPGNPEQVTVETVNALKNSNVCLYDALASTELLEYLPENAQTVYVGKRHGEHSMTQEKINLLISQYARQGKAVVRLKGGDPGIFGRLAEEITELEKWSLPYRVIPGVSSLNAATTSTGIHLTRRGISRGFSVMTLRQAGSNNPIPISRKEKKSFPQIFFMGMSRLTDVRKYLLNEGYREQENIAIILNAGQENQKIIFSDLKSLDNLLLDKSDKRSPGIVIVGKNAAEKYLYRAYGALEGKKILLTFSQTIIQKAQRLVRCFGGIPVSLPMIKLIPNIKASKILEKIGSYDWLIITSPSAVKCLLEIMKKFKRDLRHLPKILTCGPETSNEFINAGIIPVAEAEKNYGEKGILEKAEKLFRKNNSILRLRSDKAEKHLTNILRQKGYKNVDDFVLYKNSVNCYNVCPDFDAVIFGSSSGLDAFIDNFGLKKLSNKIITAIGEKTEISVKKMDLKNNIIISPPEPTAENAVTTLVAYYVKQQLLKSGMNNDE